MTVIKELDTRGLHCPLPILRAKKALTDMQSGDLLRIVATDPGSMRDFQAFSRQTGHELVEQVTEGDEYPHVLRGVEAAISRSFLSAALLAWRSQISRSCR